MTDLTYSYGSNVAATHLIHCAPVAGIASLSSPGANPSFHSGFGWIELYGTDGTKTYDEDCEETDSGDVWKVSTGLYYPGDTLEVRNTITQLKAWKRFIVNAQDKHGIWRRLGTKTEFLTVSYNFSIGPEIGDRRGYKISFAGMLSAAPPILTL